MPAIASSSCLAVPLLRCSSWARSDACWATASLPMITIVPLSGSIRGANSTGSTISSGKMKIGTMIDPMMNAFVKAVYLNSRQMMGVTRFMGSPQRA